jgi:tetratricopeptide (TPR) repeat protein
LFNLKRIDEGLAHYDRRIAAAKGDSTKRLRLIGMKAQMVVSHEGPIEKTVQACVEFREAAEPKSEPWWTASHLLAREYQCAGQHQKAIELLEELLAIDKQPVKTFAPGCSLAAAESYIALGQMDRAKAHIGDAKKAAAALARSGQKMDRDVAAYLERRIPELEKRMSNAKTKQ